jgi:thioredoxin 1
MRITKCLSLAGRDGRAVFPLVGVAVVTFWDIGAQYRCMNLIMAVAAGAGIGAALGYFGKCSSGGCALTATWWRGAMFGGLLGAVVYSTSAQGGSGAMNESGQNVTRIAETQFAGEVEKATGPVVVDFYATWCGPCKMLSPRLDKLAGEFSGKIKFVKVNVDEAQQLAGRFRVEGIPTLLFFKDGKLEDRVTGLLPEEALKSRLSSLVK